MNRHPSKPTGRLQIAVPEVERSDVFKHLGAGAGTVQNSTIGRSRSGYVVAGAVLVVDIGARQIQTQKPKRYKQN